MVRKPRGLPRGDYDTDTLMHLVPRFYRGTHRVKRGIRFASWMVVSVITAVVALSGVVGYVWLLKQASCADSKTVTVAASPDQYTVLDDLAQQWKTTKPMVDGMCSKVVVTQANSAEMAANLSPRWEPRNGERPDVWVPDSRVWIQLAAASEASSILPDVAKITTRLAFSPVVLAVPHPMAQVLNTAFPNMAVGDLAAAVARSANWSEFGHPEWGQIRLGQTDPRSSTPGLHLLLSAAFSGVGGSVSTEGITRFDDYVAVYREGADGFLSDLQAAESLENAPLFPALERDLALYNATSPSVPLAPLYLADAPAAADYPYVVLNAPWVSDTKHKIAAKFATFLENKKSREAFRSSACRTSSGAADRATGVVPENGFPSAVDPETLQKGLPSTDITRAIQEWTAQRAQIADESIAGQ